MRKRVLALLAAVLLTASLLPAAAYASEEAAATVEGMADGVTALFPRAEGHVTSSEGDVLGFDIGSSSGLKPGMELLLFRQGKPIIHPVTKAVLGNMEEPLGKATLTDVSESSSKGKLTELLVTRVVEGDTARLPNEPSKMLVVTLGPDYDTVLFDRFMRELRGSGRFDITGTKDRPEPGPLTTEEASSLAAGAGAGYVLSFATAPAAEQTKMLATVALYKADGGTLLSRTETVDSSSEVYEETVMDFPLVRGDTSDFYLTEDLPYRGKHMAVGNIMGDGTPRVVVSDGKGLVVYRFVDRMLQEVWREEGSITNNVLSLECADLNGDGVDEIYVTNFDGDSVSSYVVEYTGGEFRHIAGPMGVMFRVLDVPGRAPMLLTTTKGSDAPYSGIMYEYKWVDGALVKGDKVDLPYKIKDPYGFALMDLVPDKPGAREKAGDKGPFDGLEIVWVDDADYLEVLDMNGKRLWKSPDHYGGYDNYFELDRQDLALSNVDPRGKVKGRLIVRDDPTGNKVVVLTRNVPLTYATERFKGYSVSDIFALSWDNDKMDVAWSIRNIDGYIADIAVGEIATRGRDEIMVLVDPTMKVLKKSKSLPLGSVGSISNINAAKSSLLVYKVPLR